jgi:hypothetical protein
MSPPEQQPSGSAVVVVVVVLVVVVLVDVVVVVEVVVEVVVVVLVVVVVRGRKQIDRRTSSHEAPGSSGITHSQPPTQDVAVTLQVSVSESHCTLQSPPQVDGSCVVLVFFGSGGRHLLRHG